MQVYCALVLTERAELRELSTRYSIYNYLNQRQRGSVGKYAIGSIQWPISENLSIDAWISQLFLTQTEL